MVKATLKFFLAIIFLAGVITPAHAQEKPEIFVQMGHSDSIKSVFFTSDGSYLISGADNAIKIWEAATGKEIRTLRQSDQMTAFAVCPDNQKILAGDEKGNLHLWDINTGKLLGKFTGKSPSAVSEISISPDGRYAVSTHYGALAYWDMVKKKQIFVLDRDELRYTKGYASHIKTAAFLSDSNKIVMGIEIVNANFQSRAVNIEIYDVKKKKMIKNYEVLKGNLGINSVAVSPDEKYYFASVSVAKSSKVLGSTEKLLIVDARNGNIVKELSFSETFYSIAFSPRGDYAAAGYGEVIIYETGNWTEVKKIGGVRLPLAFSPDGQNLVYGNESEIAYYGEHVYKAGLDLVDLKSWQRVRRFSGNVDFATSGRFLEGGREIISSHWLLLYWDREKGALSKSLTLKDSLNRKVTLRDGNAFSSDRKYAIVGNDYGSYICDLPGGQMKKIMDKPLAMVDFASDNKSILFSTYDRKIVLWDIENNKSIRLFADWGNKAKLYIDSNKLSRDGQYVVAAFTDHERHEEDLKLIVVWDAQTGRQVNEIKSKSSIFSLVLSPDGKHILTSEFDSAADGYEIVMRGITNGNIIRRFKGHKEYISSVAFSPDGEWVVITPEGYFNASPNGAKHLNVRVGNNVYPIDNFYEKFFNPVYVASVLQGKKVEAVADIRKGILTPPDVKIISPEPNTSFSTDTVTITVSAKDTGGGIDEIRLYHNGKAIGEDTRGVKIVPKDNEAVKTYTVTLVDGANTFRATAFSKDRTESNPYELIVKLSAPSKDVSMHVFAVGINKYKNPALNEPPRSKLRGIIKLSICLLVIPACRESFRKERFWTSQNDRGYGNPVASYRELSSLNYAEPDAKGIADFFKQRGKGLFKNVEIKEIYNEQATKQGIASKLKQLENTQPQDAVLIYLAGHGENINDKWYFIPHELTYPEREEDVKAKGISSDELSGYIKNIKAQKILLLIDACKSGAVLIAFRGFEDRKALSQLSRSTGVHIVAASTKDQFAAEVKDLGHGVFTYTLLEGLKGKAAGKGETVTVRKLMGYIEEKLPEITKKYKQEAQYPVVDSRGMDFPLVIAK